jgi:hypothetical protein
VRRGGIAQNFVDQRGAVVRESLDVCGYTGQGVGR